MPKVVDHDLRRTSIVEATCAVIARHGLDGSTMRKIATEAGSTTGLVTHYFSNKDELLIGALRHVQTAAGSRMLTAIADLSERDALDAAIDQALPLDKPRLDEWKVWLAFWGKASSDPHLQAEQNARYAEWASLLETLVTNAQLDVHVDGLIALVDGIGTRAALNPESLPPHRQLQLIEDYLSPA